MIQIKQATDNYLKPLASLFDGYRVFYKQDSDVAAAETFLMERFKNNDSIIYLAFIGDEAVGFTQLYPLFSSVSMQPMFLLNDLYVDANHRNKGIGEALIGQAKTHCQENQMKGLAIQTAHDNPAQHLYERLGFVRDTDLQFFWHAK